MNGGKDAHIFTLYISERKTRILRPMIIALLIINSGAVFYSILFDSSLLYFALL